MVFNARYFPAFLLLAILAFLPIAAVAQELSINLGDEGSLTVRTVQIFVLVTLLSLAPGMAIMITCFPFMVTVLSILRQAVGVQQAPPNMMIVSLALFLTYFVMEPVFREAWELGVQPMLDGILDVDEAMPLIIGPFRAFMELRVDAATLAEMMSAAPAGIERTEGETPLAVLVPSFLLSEIQRVLMSMGMMMVPPAVVALPFKLAFFVIADGWALLAGAMVRSYG